MKDAGQIRMKSNSLPLRQLTPKDSRTWTRLPNVFVPFNRNGVLFPRKINAEYVMLSRPSDSGHTPFSDIFLSRSKDLIYWGRHARHWEKL